MKRIWVVVADEGIARVLERPGQDADLMEVETLTDAAAHADRADLRRDAYGKRGGGGDNRMGGNATSSAGEDEKRLEAARFARRLADRLSEARRQQRFDSLKLAAPPRFLGELRQALDAQTAEVVIEEVDKDLIHENERALTRRMFPPAA
jgi:protein required for attachment to host cells